MEIALSMIKNLALVLLFAGIIWVSLSLYRRKRRESGLPFEIKEIMRLDSRNSIYVLERKDREFIIGVSPNGIHLLHECESADIKSLELPGEP